MGRRVLGVIASRNCTGNVGYRHEHPYSQRRLNVEVAQRNSFMPTVHALPIMGDC